MNIFHYRNIYNENVFLGIMKNTVIVADPKRNAWEFSKNVVRMIRKRHNLSEYPKLVEIDMRKFPIGEYCPTIMSNVRKKDVFFIHDSSLDPNDWWVQLVLVNDALMRSDALSITDVLPCMFYLRQDRKDQPHVPISAKVLADTIHPGSPRKRIITTDMHSEQEQGFYNMPVDNLYAHITLCDYIRQNYPGILRNMVVVAPDVGASKRASKYAKYLGLELVVMDKTRNVKSGKVDDTRLYRDVRGKNILIGDDIIDTGGTMMSACKRLIEGDVKKIYLAGTHGWFSPREGGKDTIRELENFAERIFVTDSLPKDYSRYSKVTLVSLDGLYAEAIYRAQKGLSVSNMFKED